MAATKDASPKSLQLDRYQGLTPSSTTHDKLFQRTELMLLQPNSCPYTIDALIAS